MAIINQQTVIYRLLPTSPEVRNCINNFEVLRYQSQDNRTLYLREDKTNY